MTKSLADIIQMTIILPQFTPPEAKLCLRNVSIRSEKMQDLEVNQSFRAYEIFSLTDRYPSFEETLVTVADAYPDQLSGDQLSGLADLVTGRWRELHKRHRQKPALTQDYISPRPLRQFTLSEKLISDLDNGTGLLSDSKRLRIAVERWYTGVRRSDSLDTVLDLCSSLEACFGLRSELRLRLSFAVRELLGHPLISIECGE